MAKKKATSSKRDLKSLLQQLKELSTAPATISDFIGTLGLAMPLVLQGEESLRVKRLIEYIQKNNLPADTAVTKFFGGELNSKAQTQNLKATLRSSSLFASNELVIIFQTDEIKAAFANEVLPVLESLADHKLVILTQSTKVKKHSLLDKLSCGTMVAIPNLSGPALIQWITKEAKDLGINGIEPAAAQALAKGYEGSLDLLSQELAKLALLTDPKESITAALVNTYAQVATEKTSFELLEAISRKNFPVSAALTRDLLTQGFHPLQLSSFLIKCFRVMIANEQTKHGLPATTDTELGNKWFLSKLSTAMRRFTSLELRESISVLKILDEELKGSKLSDATVLLSAVERLSFRRAM